MTTPEGDPPAPDPFRGPSWGADPEPAEPGTAPERQRRRRASRRTLRRRRRYGIGLVVVGGLILLTGVYLVVTALLARSQLNTVRSDVAHLRKQIATGDLDGARATARSITDHADTAHSFTSGPVWALAANIPAGGAPFDTVRTMSGQIDVLGQQILPTVVSASRGLDPSTLRRPNGSIDLARIQAVAPTLDAADIELTRATSRVAARPADSWLNPVDSARTQLIRQMRSLGRTLHSADLAAHIAPQMLGADGVKRYFVGFQNDAEARGTGGIPGAFAIVRADHGKLSFEHFESDATLTGVDSGVKFGEDYDRLWGYAGPTSFYINSNASAHFPYAAQIWSAMWFKKSGERLDGAVAVDPQALSYLLAVTGPAALPDGTRVSARNVVQLTQQTLYDRFGNDATGRKNYLLAVARTVSTTILNSKASTTALVRAGGRAGALGRLMVYSAHKPTEALLQETSLAGAVPDTSRPYANVSVNNTAANKIDYYLKWAMAYRRSGCGSERKVQVTIRVTNNAPPGLPGYVTGPYATGKGGHPPPGSTRLAIAYYATRGASLSSAKLDGQPVGLNGGYEMSHPVFVFPVPLALGQTRTLSLSFTEPAGTGRPVVVRQAMIRPFPLTVRNQSCG